MATLKIKNPAAAPGAAPAAQPVAETTPEIRPGGWMVNMAYGGRDPYQWTPSARIDATGGAPDARVAANTPINDPRLTAAAAVAKYGNEGTLKIPGTVVLVGVFFVSFVLYYYVNWKYLAELWPLK